ncbi:MAG: tRNA guanosine(34) transglycosylase Tgt [Desulfobacterales bacterium]|nr:tRNA guanosine(34) transglycosylase Tgt [Desulfobacterales bacterium]
METFHINSAQGKARVGRITTLHGTIDTPAFIPVATLGAVHYVSADDLQALGTQALIANTYHLHLRPGEKLISQLGGLHSFMGWHKPLITDSGGFQVFSLGIGKYASQGKAFQPKPIPQNLKTWVSVNNDGVQFVSYVNGSKHQFTPESVIDIQFQLGSDIFLVLDECTSPQHDYDYTKTSMERTHQWAVRSVDAFVGQNQSRNHQLFGIIQGGYFKDLRQKSAEFIQSLPFHGYAIGGILGRNKQEMVDVISWVNELLPENKPRHLLGIGELEDIRQAVALGIDFFDCITPTRLAKTGTFLIRDHPRNRIHITNSSCSRDENPVSLDCPCIVCKNHSRAFLHHLFKVNAQLGCRLAAIHNVLFMEHYFNTIRTEIRENRFKER